MGGKTIVGWREYVDLPEWGVERVLAKIDTGARTSAMHVENLVHTTEDTVSFEVVKSRKKSAVHQTIEATIVRTTRIRTSTGQDHERYVVETLMRLGQHEKRIQLTLVSRKHMVCRMLLGRTALEDDFLVDVALRHTSARP